MTRRPWKLAAARALLTGGFVFVGACAPRNAILEVTVPLRTSGVGEVRGLALQVRVVDLAGGVRSLGPFEADAAASATRRYSVEADPPEPFALEVCLCEAGRDTTSCFDDDGVCRGVGASRGGLVRSVFDRAHYVGERTRWVARDCESRCSGVDCPLADAHGEACEIHVHPCTVEGCCGADGCGGIDRLLPGPFCVDGHHFCELTGAAENGL